MRTLGGDAVIPSWLSTNCQLGELPGGVGWSAFSSEAGGEIINWSAFGTVESVTYQTPTTLWEYIAWSEIGPNITASMRDYHPSFPALSKVKKGGTFQELTTTEAKSTYAMGGCDIKVTRDTATEQVDLEMTMTMTYEASLGHAVPYHMTGGGTVTREVDGSTVTMTVTMDMYTNTTGTPESGTMTMVTSDGYTISMTISSDGSQDGTVTETSSGDTMGTIHINADGSGTFTDAATGEEHTFEGPGSASLTCEKLYVA